MIFVSKDSGLFNLTESKAINCDKSIARKIARGEGKRGGGGVEGRRTRQRSTEDESEQKVSRPEYSPSLRVPPRGLEKSSRCQ